MPKTTRHKIKPSAIDAIKTVALVRNKLGTDYCAFIVQPNTVLTLANARGYADSVFYHPDPAILKEWQEAQKAILLLLGETRDLLFETHVSKNTSGENYAGFDLINRAGLAYSLASYSFLSPSDASALLKAPTLPRLMDTFKRLLKQKTAFEKFNRIQIMHLSSGAILGYPERAILSTVDSYLIEPNEFTPPDISADIRGASYYDCPQPVYSYPRHLATDESIAVHEQLWSQILMDFYTSDMHQELVEDKAFQRKIKALSSY